MGRRQFAIALVATALLGCGGGGDGEGTEEAESAAGAGGSSNPGAGGHGGVEAGGIAHEEFRVTLAWSFCQGLQPCCEELELEWDSERCQIYMQPLLEVPASDAPVRYDSLAAAQCIEEIGELVQKCSGFGVPESCYDTFHGLAGLGDDCRTSLECAPLAGGKIPACLDGTCSSSEVDKPLTVGDETHGTSCSTDRVCTGTCHNGVCVPTDFAEICGCSVPLSCENDYDCTNPDTVCVDQQCVEAGAAGGPCRADGTCDADHFCVVAVFATPGILPDGIASAECPDDPSLTCCVATGIENHPCHNDGSCDEGLFCLWSEAAGVDCRASDCCVAAGEAGQACLPDGSCNDDLVCAPDQSCGSALTPGGYRQCCVVSGEAGGPCNPDGSCNSEDLVCGMQTVTYPPTGPTCLAAGAEGQLCREDGSCDAGLDCVNSFACSLGAGSCCLAAGGDGEPCLADGSCDAGMECTGCSQGNCCVAVGAEGQPCRADGSCDEGLGCVFDSLGCTTSTDTVLSQQCCVPTGSVNAPCNSDGSCNAGLACISSSACPLGAVSCCLNTGGIGEPCNPDGTCEGDSLRCVATGYEPSTDYQCLLVGNLGEPCFNNGECLEGLTCVYGASSCPNPITGCCALAG